VERAIGAKPQRKNSGQERRRKHLLTGRLHEWGVGERGSFRRNGTGGEKKGWEEYLSKVREGKGDFNERRGRN